jgi:hypothetical protein
MRRKTSCKRRRVRGTAVLTLIAALAAIALSASGAAAQGVAGAAYTTDDPLLASPSLDVCQTGGPNDTGEPKVNCNQYNNKEDVWINGGPTNGNSTLTDGYYFFAVLEPGGQANPNDGGAHNLSDAVALGGDPAAGGGDPASNRRFRVSSNQIAESLGSHVTEAGFPSQGLLVNLSPYDTTSNGGGVYILAICFLSSSSDAIHTVDPRDCKYDAFKVGEGAPPPPFGLVSGRKYYDANRNGQYDSGEDGISAWNIDITNSSTITVQTQGVSGLFSMVLEDGDYSIAEQQATNQVCTSDSGQIVCTTAWLQTGNTVDQTSDTGSNTSDLAEACDPALPTYVYCVHVADAGTTDGLNFGNVCVGAGGGLTLGFWSNKNGAKLITASDLTFLSALNLRNGDGSNFNPAAIATFQKWLLNAKATNMANMLSAQLAAMELNVRHGFVSGSAEIFAPGAISADSNGFASVNNVMDEANTELGLHGVTKSGSPYRAYQKHLKDALDLANNNLNFFQTTLASCPRPPTFF